MFNFIKGVVLLSNVQKLYKLLAIIAEKDKSEPIRKDAALALINLSANKDVALKMTKLKKKNAFKRNANIRNLKKINT